MERGKIIILSAPSGTGKSSIIRHLMEYPDLKLGFSVSATCRAPRGEERHGVDYYFITHEEFMKKVANGEFVEWEEVYAGTCYGTLRSEIERVIDAGKNIIMDIDVKGGLNVKKIFGGQALTIFILPPSKAELERRLRGRATDSEDVIRKRLDKADYELSFAPQFDLNIVNDNLDHAVAEVRSAILSSPPSDN
ncbi:MAG: guanylate kinase [Muribaculum sp.]|nr:guanylate kinase [Muribaculum sp.]